jgi:hypothetical protein
VVTVPTLLLTEPVPFANTAVSVVDPPDVIVPAATLKLVMLGAGTIVKFVVFAVLLKLA